MAPLFNHAFYTQKVRFALTGFVVILLYTYYITGHKGLAAIKADLVQLECLASYTVDLRGAPLLPPARFAR